MEQVFKLKKAGVDFVQEHFPRDKRAELKKLITLGRAVEAEKVGEVGIENPLDTGEMKAFSRWQYYKLWTEATPDELEELEREGIRPEEDEEDQEYEQLERDFKEGKF